MKKILFALALMLAAGAMAQDSLWVRYDNRFKENRFVMDLSGYDSVEFRCHGQLPILRRYTGGTYQDKTLTGLTSGGEALVVGDPGRILWKPTTSDSQYNNDYMVTTNRWTLERSRESEHFVVFWDKTFGPDPNVKASTNQSGLTVDVDDMLQKMEQFYRTNVETLAMCETGGGRSQLDKYKMAVYLIDQSEWLATGSGNDNRIGTLWVNPSTCQPVGSTIAHEIGHSFQYQTYCDNILRGRPNDFHSGFRYGYPNSNGGCGFWEQCAQWQSFQDYPKEAITTYDFTVWIKNCHRHFEHEWQRYASYWEQYYWMEQHGATTLGHIWNESRYPEDANQAYMRLYLGGSYDSLRTDLFRYAQHTVTFDYTPIRPYVGSAYDRYRTTLYNVEDGWQQVGYGQCPQPTGFNVIPLSAQAGDTVRVTLRALAEGSPLPQGDQGKEVDGDGKTVGEAHTTYNKVDLAGHEGLAFGFVTLLTGGGRAYSPLTLATTSADAQATLVLPAGARRAWLVVQGSPDRYYQCPWDEKESTDRQLPYRVKIE